MTNITKPLSSNRKRNAEELNDTSPSSGPGDSESVRKRVRWDGEDQEVSDNENGDDDETESQDDECTEKICLAMSCQFGRVGCAYYDPQVCKMYIFEDSQENAHYDLTSMLLDQVEPDVVLTSSKAEDMFIDVLRAHVDSSGSVFQLRPHKDFLPNKGRDRILSLRLLSELVNYGAEENTTSDRSSDSEPRNAYDFMRRRKEGKGDPTGQRWNASVRLANYASLECAPLCLGSIGALLDHIARMRAVADLDDEGIGGLEIRAIEYLPLKQVMQINADALQSLQIFETENHASVNSDNTKEGLSLFGILNNTKTSLGRLLMREWLLRPSLSIPVITARHDAVACFMHPDNLTLATTMHNHLQGIKNIPKTMKALKVGKAKLSDWQSVVKFAFHSVMLNNSLPELSRSGDIDILRKLSHVLEVASFKDIGTAVNEMIDWDESALWGRVCVRPHIDEALDAQKHVYAGLDSILSTVAHRISPTVPSDYARSVNVVYFPQLGFLVSVPMRDEWNEHGVVELEGWTFQFSSEENAYFKNKEMRDLDKHIGDVQPAIADREIEIVYDLQMKVLEYEKAISAACDVCAELDCLLSFADASRAYNFNRPEMSEDNVIDIKGGRHPLQELVVDTFVPNDAYLVGGDFDGLIDPQEGEDSENESISPRDNHSILVCTGANACGKSVYLKQVALIQYMAQIGCFVPAERATLGIVDKIFTRIQTRESVSKVQSAFMIDLNQVSLALRNCTSRSLILLDEFGKGTLATDGAGLFCGILQHFVGRGNDCPKVIAATHFHDIFRQDILDPDSLPVTFVHMQVLFTTSKGELLGASDTGTLSAFEEDTTADHTEAEGGSMIRPGEGITYLYRVEKGLWLNSHAAMCAEIFGLPRSVVQRARYVSFLLSTRELGQLLDEDMNEGERTELAQAEEVCKRFLAWDLQTEMEGEEDVNEKLAAVLGRAPDE
ncbi:unnamed protein product [Somion occarium]|uniref:DNA mismatch repair proteins mutS family domain-containing protein n=1 Tax=Somion occarium TaxID=3059160 RepID=A0ABP1E1X8_9APHY